MPLITVLAAAQKSSGFSAFLPILLVGFAAFYFFVLRPRQKAAQAQRKDQSPLDIGDVVVTIGGVRGVVVALDEEQVTIATGQLPGDDPAQSAVTHITFVRKAIGQKITPSAPEDEEPTGDAADPEGSDGEAGSEGP